MADERSPGTFQDILINLATRFINQPAEQIDATINQALRQIVEFMRAGRSSINQLVSDGREFAGIYHYATDAATQIGPTERMPDFRYVTNFLRAGEAILHSDLNELPADSEFRQRLQEWGVNAILIVPLFDKGELFGFISISWAEPHPIAPSFIGLLRLVGEIFINALNRKRTEEVIRDFAAELEQRVIDRTAELREQQRLTEALLESGMQLSSTLRLDEVLGYVLSGIQRIVPYDTASVIAVEGERATHYRQWWHVTVGGETAIVEETASPEDDYYLGRVLRSQKPLIWDHREADSAFTWISEGRTLKSYVGVPIIFRQRLIGAISLGHHAPNFFNETHLKYLQIFGMQAGAAVQNALLFEQARTVAALEERQRLARDLHDAVTQTLFAANTVVEALPRVMQQNPHKVERYLQDLHQFTQGALAEMRSLLVELRPEALTRTELGVLLTQLCDAFTGRTQIEVEKRINKHILLPPDSQIVFYRVAQETLNNIAKHARASHVRLDLNTNPECIELRIEDDGQGFDPHQVNTEHFGLKIMRERAAEVLAELKIESQPGGGTQIILRGKMP